MSKGERFAHRTVARAVTVLAAAASTVLLVASCTTSGGDSGGDASVEEGFNVGLLLPESKTARYEKFDKPFIEKSLEDQCPKCKLSYQNADQETAKQQSQAEAMLTEGIDVLILDAVDSEAAGSIVRDAKGQGVPVVAYDRLAEGGVDYYVSFDNETIGETQGKALLDVLKERKTTDKGKVVMINGSPTDPNAADYKRGAHSVLDDEVDIGAEYDTPDWSPDKAQEQMDAAISDVGLDEINGVYSANDGMSAGVVAAMKSAGADDLPPITGQDAEIAGLQRIAAGEQYMTVHKEIKDEARIVVEMAVAKATGEEYDGEQKPKDVKDGGGDTVPAVLLPPVPVTEGDIQKTVIDGGYYTVDEICTDEYADTDFCKDAGGE